MDNDNIAAFNEASNRPKKKKKKRRNSTLTAENSIEIANDNIQQVDNNMQQAVNNIPQADNNIQQTDNNIQRSVIETKIVYRSKCPCDIHYTKLLIEHSYDLPVDLVFDLIFGCNEFVRSYRQAQRLYDLTESDWRTNEQTNYLERTLNYKVPFETRLMGKSIIITQEKQIRVHEVPGSHYVIETEVRNDGVKYSDTFALIIRFCIVQTSPRKTNLLVTARIQYIKSVNGIIKQFIERSSYSASQDGLKDLNVRLNALKNSFINEHRLVNGDAKLTESFLENVQLTSQPDILQPVQQLQVTTIINDINASTTINTCNDTRHSSMQSSDNDKIMYILIILVVILTLIHIYLYKKLQRTDLLLDTLIRLLKKRN